MKKHDVSYDSKGFKQAVKEFEDLLKSKRELEENMNHPGFSNIFFTNTIPEGNICL
jgi:hypothetical protein